MASYNKCIFMGNLTRDPSLSYLPNQTPVVEFGLAMNRKWTDRQTNQQREDVCFVDCRCYGKQAETINQYCRKGKPLLVEGRLEFDQWEASDGTRRSKHRVFVERFTFLPDAQQGGQQPSNNGRHAPHQAAAPQNPQPQQANSVTAPQVPSEPYPPEDDPSGDIPF